MIRKKSIKWMALIIIVFAIGAYISDRWFQLMLIQGSSMEPVYHNLQLVVLEKDIETSSIGAGDVIAFWCDGFDTVLVKRVVALSGQKVAVCDSTLYIDGTPSEYYNTGAFTYAGLLAEPIALGKDEYIVIGDNVAESKDSRHEQVGIVEYQDIIGKILTKHD